MPTAEDFDINTLLKYSIAMSKNNKEKSPIEFHRNIDGMIESYQDGRKTGSVIDMADLIAPPGEIHPFAKGGMLAKNREINRRASIDAPAIKSDWKTKDMPRQRKQFVLRKHLTDEEMTRLACGNIPQEGEDKWFWYYEDGRIYVHRSWTGICIYILSFTSGSEEIRVIVNRDPKQYRCDSISEDQAHLARLLDWWIAPVYDYYQEWLSEPPVDVHRDFPVAEMDSITVGSDRVNAVYFHKPEEPGGFLSNWFLSDYDLDGMTFSSAEQYIMYRKCLLFGDKDSAFAVMAAADPAEQQQIARNIKNYSEPVWNGFRQVVAMRALLAKFQQNNTLRESLLQTDDAWLVECAKSDTIWACGCPLYDPGRKDISLWKGENLLGFTLMEVREIIRKGIPRLGQCWPMNTTSRMPSRTEPTST